MIIKIWDQNGKEYLPGDGFNLQFCISQIIKWGNHQAPMI
jgi:hypothetical protein